ncbi:MAG: hypothetical protein K2N51_16980 [Lachnospiraceae bacterium]|nr:hypothetical protein [Lachnospiraceae bacterium]
MDEYRQEVINWTDTLDFIPTRAVVLLAENKLDNIIELTPKVNENVLDFPTYDTMWRFKNGFDSLWIKNNANKFREIGFRVFDSDIFGIIFGLEDTNFDFYFEHFEPLYNAFYSLPVAKH